MPGQKNSLS